MCHTRVNLIQLKTFELELDFAEYIQYTDVRIADLCCPPYAIYRVTSYLRLFALSILTCSPNMSFLARLVSDNFRSLEKFELGHCPLQPLPKQRFLHGVWVLVRGYTWASDLTFLALLASEIQKVSPNWGPRILIRGQPTLCCTLAICRPWDRSREPLRRELNARGVAKYSGLIFHAPALVYRYKWLCVHTTRIATWRASVSQATNGLACIDTFWLIDRLDGCCGNTDIKSGVLINNDETFYLQWSY